MKHIVIFILAVSSYAQAQDVSYVGTKVMSGYYFRKINSYLLKDGKMTDTSDATYRFIPEKKSKAGS